MQELLNMDIVQESAVLEFENGSVSVEDLTERLKPQLLGIPAISAVLNLGTGEQLSFLECFNRGYITNEVALMFLEAQVSAFLDSVHF